ncbi:MAG: peptidoglycan-binding protein with multiple lysin domain [Bacteroidota bacterium]
MKVTVRDQNHGCRYFYSMRNIFLILLTLLPFTKLFAQIDSTKKVSILLIPYSPEYYLSDAEKDILDASAISQSELHEAFRKTLDLKLSAELETLGSCKSMLSDTSRSGKMKLGRYYYSTGYSYQEPVGKRVARESELPKAKKKNSGGSSQHTAPQSITTRGDSKYMRATPSDTIVLKQLRSSTASDYIVSINQFEIKTNYNTCLDIANKIYRREVIVHYSVFDANGKEVLGNYAVAFFPSNTNRYGDIVERCFPEIAREITTNIKSQTGKK